VSIDVSALVRALRENPADRAALREVLAGEDLDLRATLAELAAAQRRTEHAVQGLVDVVAGMQDRMGDSTAPTSSVATASAGMPICRGWRCGCAWSTARRSQRWWPTPRSLGR